MEKINYFVLKYRSSNGCEFWDTSLYTSYELSDCVADSISKDLIVVGIKHLVLD